MISGIVPRPIAFVSTLSKENIGNLAPYSYFGVVSHDPPLISVSICTKGEQVKKDTLVNIEDTNEFTVNIISDWFTESASHCSGLFEPSIDEFDLSGLTRQPSTKIKPPR